MGRSVSYASNSAHVEYSAIDAQDGDDFGYLVEDYQNALIKAFPSASVCSEWVGREDWAVVENSFAYFGFSQYGDLVSLWVQPKDDNYAASYGLRDKWIDSIGPKFAKVCANCFGQSLVKQGQASNGEAIFQPANGKQQGGMGLGFSSKEGWL